MAQDLLHPFQKDCFNHCKFQWFRNSSSNKETEGMQREEKNGFLVGNARNCMMREIKETKQIWLFQLSRLQERGKQQK